MTCSTRTWRATASTTGSDAGGVERGLERLGVCLARVGGPGDAVDRCALGLERLAGEHVLDPAADLRGVPVAVRQLERDDVRDLRAAHGDLDLDRTVARVDGGAVDRLRARRTGATARPAPVRAA